MEMDFSKMESDAQRAHQRTLGMVASVINNIPMICNSEHFSLKHLWKHQKGAENCFLKPSVLFPRQAMPSVTTLARALSLASQAALPRSSSPTKSYQNNFP